MGFQITPIIGAPVGQEITSGAVTITDVYGDPAATIQGVTPALAGATLIKNDVDVGASTTLVNGDTLAIRGTAPAGYTEAAFGAVLIEGFALSVFGVRTEVDPASTVLDPALVDAPYLDYVAGYTPATPDNKMVKVDTGSNAATTHNIAVVGAAVPGTVDDGNPYVFIADTVGGRVHRIDVTTGAVVQSIVAGGAHGVSYSPIQAPFENVPTRLLVTTPSSNVVYTYDESHNLLHAANTGAGPYGIAGDVTKSVGDYGFWVACFGADRIEHWKYTSGSALVRDYYYDLDVGSGPYEVAVDGDGNCWATCLKSDKIAQCPIGGAGVVSYTDVGTDPWGLALTDDYAYVACAGTSTVDVIRLSDGVDVGTLSVIANPTAIYIANSKLYVGAMESGLLYVYPLTTFSSIGAGTNITEAQRMLEGVTSNIDGSLLFAAAMHNDVPLHLALPDNTPDNLVFTSQTGLASDTVVTSNEVTLTGIDEGPGKIDVPDIYNMDIIKNGSSINDTSSTFVDTDTIALEFSTPTDPVLMYFPILSETGATIWVNTMTPGVKQRIGGWIQGG